MTDTAAKKAETGTGSKNKMTPIMRGSWWKYRECITFISGVIKSKVLLNIQRYTRIAVHQAAPFETRNNQIDLVISW